MKRNLLWVAMVVGGMAFARAQEMVPFVIPWKPGAESLIAFSSGAIAADGERVVVRDAQFWCGKERVRIWGVNLCFGACFPRHEDAEQVAARLAGAGVNSVRFHHMDSAAFPRGIWDPKDATRLSAEALDRLDYFIDQLARRGVYANINLHVSRTHSKVLGLPDTSGVQSYDKMVDVFTPELVEAQKRYAREVLTHVNAYRKVRYADDAAVAFVEINNEDSLFMWGAEQKLRTLPEYYAKVLQGQYVGWLKKRYGVTAKLGEAWEKGTVPLGQNVLADADFALALKGGPKPGEKGWRLSAHAADCEVKAARAGNTLNSIRAEIGKADDVTWHIQLLQNQIAVKGEQYYTVSFRARADKARKASVGLQQAHEPWKGLGLYRALDLTAGWQDVQVAFVASADEENAQLAFNLGGSAVGVEIAEVQFRPGGLAGLGEKESLEAGNVAVYADNEGPERSVDRMRFLAETERAYFDGMREFVKKDLGCKALVTGTIVFGPLGLWAQSAMDYVDGHAYWQHPRFPRKPWDAADWTVEQVAMVDKPGESTLVRLSAERLAGKPFTVSEYNHPAPNDYQAECVPMVSAWAAAQDWDGVWLFAYNHATDDWQREQFKGFFDIDGNPAKWGFVRAGAAVFREGGIGPLEQAKTVPLANGADVAGDMAKLHLKYDRDILGVVCDRAKVARADLLRVRLAVSLGGGATLPSVPPGRSYLHWSALEERARFSAGGAGAQVLVAHGVHHPAEAMATCAELQSPGFAAFAVVALDGKALDKSGKVLVTACGRCENTGMAFTPERRSVGRSWGKGPVRIEPVGASIELPGLDRAGGWTCWALGPDGKKTEKVPLSVSSADRCLLLKIDPKYKTMWYLLIQE